MSQNYQSIFTYLQLIQLEDQGKAYRTTATRTALTRQYKIDEILQQFGLKLINIASVSNGSYLASYYTITNPTKVNKMVGMAGGVKVNMLRMMLLFLPEALFPVSEKTTKKLPRKLCALNTSIVFENNEDIMFHWTVLGEMLHTFLLFPHIQKWNDGV